LLTATAYPALQVALNEQKALLNRIEGEQGNGDGKEVDIRIRDINKNKEVVFIPNSTPPPSVYINSFDIESDAGSLDLIQRNVNFVEFI
jgi:hypothetical protein